MLDARQAWAQAGPSFTIGGTPTGGYGYAGAAPSAGGTMMTISGMPGYVVTKTLLNDTTRASYAFVDNGGTGAVQQPQTAASLTATNVLPNPIVDNDWAAGDTVQPYTMPLVNLKKWSPVGGDLAAGSAPTMGIVIGARIYDASGGTGTSEYPHETKSASNALSLCQVDTRLHMATLSGRGSGGTVMGTTVVGQTFINSGVHSFIGGGFAGGIQDFAGFGTYSENVVLHGNVALQGLVQTFIGAFMDGALNVVSPQVEAQGIEWGSYIATVDPMGAYWNNTGSTFALKALLTSGAIKLGTLTTGSTSPTAVSTFTMNGISEVAVSGTFPISAPIWWSLKTVGTTPCASGGPYFDKAQTAGQFFVKSVAANCNDVYNWQAGVVDGIPLTPANIDLYGGLQNVATGARYSNLN